MLRGINHQIIEVRQTDNPYFERALLFVNTAYADRSEDTLQQEGERFLRQADSFSGLRSARAMRWFRGVLLTLVGGLIGTFLGILLSGTGL